MQKPDQNDLTADDKFLEEFMREQQQDQGIIKFGELVRSQIQKLDQAASSRHGSDDEDEEMYELSETLVTQIFAIMVKFQGEISNLKDAVRFVQQDPDNINELD